MILRQSAAWVLKAHSRTVRWRSAGKCGGGGSSTLHSPLPTVPMVRVVRPGRAALMLARIAVLRYSNCSWRASAGRLRPARSQGNDLE